MADHLVRFLSAAGWMVCCIVWSSCVHYAAVEADDPYAALTASVILESVERETVDGVQEAIFFLNIQAPRDSSVVLVIRKPAGVNTFMGFPTDTLFQAIEVVHDPQSEGGDLERQALILSVAPGIDEDIVLVPPQEKRRVPIDATLPQDIATLRLHWYTTDSTAQVLARHHSSDIRLQITKVPVLLVTSAAVLAAALFFRITINR